MMFQQSLYMGYVYDIYVKKINEGERANQKMVKGWITNSFLENHYPNYFVDLSFFRQEYLI